MNAIVKQVMSYKRPDLRLARIIAGITQNDLESMTGVFQSKISRFEKNGIQCLNDSEKELIEQALDMIDQIDWNANLNKKGQGMATCKISGNDYPKYRHREKMDTGK